MKTYVLSISDTRTIETDVSGECLSKLLTSVGAEIIGRSIVSDDLIEIRDAMLSLCGRYTIDVLVTSGGTGLGPRDNTPEATRLVIEREVPGIAEAMRLETLKFTRTAMLSRGICGTRGKTLILNLPGSPKGVEECFSVVASVLSHAVAVIAGEEHITNV